MALETAVLPVLWDGPPGDMLLLLWPAALLCVRPRAWKTDPPTEANTLEAGEVEEAEEAATSARSSRRLTPSTAPPGVPELLKLLRRPSPQLFTSAAKLWAWCSHAEGGGEAVAV